MLKIANYQEQVIRKFTRKHGIFICEKKERARDALTFVLLILKKTRYS